MVIFFKLTLKMNLGITVDDKTFYFMVAGRVAQ